jgi:hypothetical protein
MSAEERNRFRQQLEAEQDPQARQKLAERHRTEMQQRAKQQGVALSPDGTEIVPGDRQRKQDQDRLHDKSGAGDSMQRDRQRDRDMIHQPGTGSAGGPGRGGGGGGGSGGGGRGGRG